MTERKNRSTVILPSLKSSAGLAHFHCSLAAQTAQTLTAHSSKDMCLIPFL